MQQQRGLILHTAAVIFLVVYAARGSSALLFAMPALVFCVFLIEMTRPFIGVGVLEGARGEQGCTCVQALGRGLDVLVQHVLGDVSTEMRKIWR